MLVITDDKDLNIQVGLQPFLFFFEQKLDYNQR